MSTPLPALVLGLAAAGALAPQDPPKPTPVPDAYANPQLLVTTQWVQEHAQDEQVVIVDARSVDEYDDGHVPGALSLDVAATFDPEKPGDMASEQHLLKALGRRGISNQTHVVVYDWGRSTNAARVFWTLEVLDHPRVSVMDGGFVKWKAEERDSSTRATLPEPCSYERVPKDQRAAKQRLATAKAIVADLEAKACLPLDARSTREFKAGRIPGAVHIEWTRNFTDEDDGPPVMLAPKALHALYADQGVTLEKRLHAY